jgi:hypothetical protein
MIRFLAFVSLLLGLVAAATFFLLENPDRFKNQISQGIESATGYEVTVNCHGDTGRQSQSMLNRYISAPPVKHPSSNWTRYLLIST